MPHLPSPRRTTATVLAAAASAVLVPALASPADAATGITVHGPRSVVVGHRITFRGHIATDGERMHFFVLRYDRAHHRWRQVAQGRTTLSGAYRVTFRPGPVGRQRFRVMPDSLDASWYAPRAVRVKPAH